MIHHICIDLTIGCRRIHVDLTQNKIDVLDFHHALSVPWSLMTPMIEWRVPHQI